MPKQPLLKKNKVLAENVLAVLSEETSNNLKNPKSFILQEGYYYIWDDEDTSEFFQRAVLRVSGTNSYGAAVSSYWLWVYENPKEKWTCWGSVTSTTIENNDDDLVLKAIIDTTITAGTKLDKSQVKNINAQFEADTLYEVELIPKDDIDNSLFKTE